MKFFYVFQYFNIFDPWMDVFRLNLNNICIYFKRIVLSYCLQIQCMKLFKKKSGTIYESFV